MHTDETQMGRSFQQSECSFYHSSFVNRNSKIFPSVCICGQESLPSFRLCAAVNFGKDLAVMKLCKELSVWLLVATLGITLSGCHTPSSSMSDFKTYTLGYDAPTDAKLQAQITAIDAKLRVQFGLATNEAAVGVLDLRHPRLALIRPDEIDYAASTAKTGILLAYFQLHPEAATNIDPVVKHELGLMAKASNNEMAAKYSRLMGLREVQAVLNSYDLYNTNHGGGLWIGKHYGKGTERIGDPLSNNSHAATVRQLMRYFLWLEQGKLVSPQASAVMREIFACPDVPHDNIKFVKGLAGREVSIIRKWGSWQEWLHDAAVITGPDRQYILVAMTHHAKGDAYLEALAQAVDDVMIEAGK